MSIAIKSLGFTEYRSCWQAMQFFTAHRNELVADEVWLTEHYPVYTLGLAGRHEHLHLPFDNLVPVVQSDRGGQVTYHAPGQIMIYTLINLAARKIAVNAWVKGLEEAVIAVLEEVGVKGHRIAGKPGVYVNGEKIAALGLRVKRGACYHGLALNVAMERAPFGWINPCGYADMAVTDLAQVLPHNHPCTEQLTDPYFWGKRIVDKLLPFFGK